MIERPEIIQTTPQRTAIIHVVVAQDEIQEVMGPTLQELMSTVADQGIKPTGPWFTHHLRRPSQTFDFELSLPVPTPVRRQGRVQPGEWPSMRAARTVYQGDYEGLGNAWGEFLDWIEAQDHRTTQDLWEVYSVGPETSSDPNNWRTELIQPLVDEIAR
jgi:effector-binding domain-containing protein